MKLQNTRMRIVSQQINNTQESAEDPFEREKPQNHRNASMLITEGDE